jgi:hypothetical protein
VVVVRAVVQILLALLVQQAALVVHQFWAVVVLAALIIQLAVQAGFMVAVAAVAVWVRLQGQAAQQQTVLLLLRSSINESFNFSKRKSN